MPAVAAQAHTGIQPCCLGRPAALPRVRAPRSDLRPRVLLLHVSEATLLLRTQHIAHVSTDYQKRLYPSGSSQLRPPPAFSAALASSLSFAPSVSTYRARWNIRQCLPLWTTITRWREKTGVRIKGFGSCNVTVPRRFVDLTRFSFHRVLVQML